MRPLKLSCEGSRDAPRLLRRQRTDRLTDLLFSVMLAHDTCEAGDGPLPDSKRKLYCHDYRCFSSAFPALSSVYSASQRRFRNFTSNEAAVTANHNTTFRKHLHVDQPRNHKCSGTYENHKRIQIIVVQTHNSTTRQQPTNFARFSFLGGTPNSACLGVSPLNWRVYCATYLRFAI